MEEAWKSLHEIWLDAQELSGKMSGTGKKAIQVHFSQEVMIIL